MHGNDFGNAPGCCGQGVVGTRKSVDNGQVGIYLAQPFVVDQSTWVSGSSLIAGTAELAIAMDGSESQAFYRIVVSATKPAAVP